MMNKIPHSDLDRLLIGKRISAVRSEPVKVFGQRSSRLTTEFTDGTRHVLEPYPKARAA